VGQKFSSGLAGCFRVFHEVAVRTLVRLGDWLTPVILATSEAEIRRIVV
jgi:hypothetical protein